VASARKVTTRTTKAQLVAFVVEAAGHSTNLGRYSVDGGLPYWKALTKARLRALLADLELCIAVQEDANRKGFEHRAFWAAHRGSMFHRADLSINLGDCLNRFRTAWEGLGGSRGSLRAARKAQGTLWPVRARV